MCVSVGSRASSSSSSSVVVGDALFADYKPNVAFLFPGQVRIPKLIRILNFDRLRESMAPTYSCMKREI